MNQDDLEKAGRIAYLVTGFIRNDLTVSERSELDEWIAADEHNMKLFGQLTDKKNIIESKHWFDSVEKRSALKKVEARIRAAQGTGVRRMPKRWMAAASVLLVLGMASIWYFGLREKSQNTGTNVNAQLQIIPGTKKAYLEVGNGKTIDLSDSKNTSIIFNDKNQATNLHSVLSYNPVSASVEMHTLRIPRGGEYQLVLPDGTRVWMNAESSLSYPTSFIGASRVVRLEGEAYFEVMHRDAQPFEVIAGVSTVKVLGTHFNVTAYGDLGQRVSLLEGSVEVRGRSDTKKLQPGQEASVSGAGKWVVSKNSNIRSRIAWTQGKFSFDETPLKEVMDQIGRWYDADIEYKTATTHEFSGEVFRNSSLAEVLRMLQLSTGEHFDTNGKTITVRP